jgi:hypothetical protein
MDRRRELKLQYRETRREMGIFVIRSKANGKCFVEATQDLRSRINSTRFKLGAGVHPHRELQTEWSGLGEDNFSFEVLETMAYDKDEAKTDYSEDLAVLQSFWQAELAGKVSFYQK